eukprot:scaffold4899_cov98-Skeletonema_marinoi.AAC.4
MPRVEPGLKPYHVCLKLAPLGNSSSNDCGGSGSESELEEPPDQACSIMKLPMKVILEAFDP